MTKSVTSFNFGDKSTDYILHVVLLYGQCGQSIPASQTYLALKCRSRLQVECVERRHVEATSRLYKILHFDSRFLEVD